MGLLWADFGGSPTGEFELGERRLSSIGAKAAPPVGVRFSQGRAVPAC